jgi:hypothetical protein
MRRLKIVSNGQPWGTTVKDAETGEDLSNSFTAARIEMDASNGFIPRLYLETIDFEFDLVGEEQPATAGDFAIESSVFAHREDTVSIPNQGEQLASDYLTALRKAQQEPA